MSLKVRHSLVQPRSTSFCRLRSTACSHLCVPSPQMSTRIPRNLGDADDMMSVCLCPQGFNLDSDGSTCTPGIYLSIYVLFSLILKIVVVTIYSKVLHSFTLWLINSDYIKMEVYQQQLRRHHVLNSLTMPQSL